MPVKRKICKIGNSFAVFLPIGWMTFNKAKFGQPVREVLIGEAGDSLILAPVPPTGQERTRTAQTSEGETKP